MMDDFTLEYEAVHERVATAYVRIGPVRVRLSLFYVRGDVTFDVNGLDPALKARISQALRESILQKLASEWQAMTERELRMLIKDE